MGHWFVKFSEAPTNSKNDSMLDALRFPGPASDITYPALLQKKLGPGPTKINCASLDNKPFGYTIHDLKAKKRWLK